MGSRTAQGPTRVPDNDVMWREDGGIIRGLRVEDGPDHPGIFRARGPPPRADRGREALKRVSGWRRFILMEAGMLRIRLIVCLGVLGLCGAAAAPYAQEARRYIAPSTAAGSG